MTAMRHAAAQLVTIGLALALGGPLLSCRQVQPKSTASQPITKRADNDIIFSHAQHAKEDVECDSCHEGVEGAKDLSQVHRPNKETCADCHEVEEKETCKTCHRNVEQPGRLPRRSPTPRLVFSHASHIERGAECVACHTSAMVSNDLASIQRPRMRSECFSCHNHLADYRALRCKDCHEALSDFPIKFVSQFNHEGDFLHEHGRWAHSQPDLCATCHRQSYCADCHSQRAVLRPSVKLAEQVGQRFIHRGDWVTRHAVEAHANPQSCTRCHSNKSCNDCHSARGVSATTGQPGARSPHPPDWLNPASPNNHGLAARRQIVQCAGCHDQGSRTNCIDCHKTRQRGGVGINPHPPGWDRNGKNSNAMCKLCH
jgi:hypothetical protein